MALKDSFAAVGWKTPSCYFVFFCLLTHKIEISREQHSRYSLLGKFFQYSLLGYRPTCSGSHNCHKLLGYRPMYSSSGLHNCHKLWGIGPYILALVYTTVKTSTVCLSGKYSFFFDHAFTVYWSFNISITGCCFSHCFYYYQYLINIVVSY